MSFRQKGGKTLLAAGVFSAKGRKIQGGLTYQQWCDIMQDVEITTK
jgi:hypothetical protein